MRHIPSVKLSIIAITILCLTRFNSPAQAKDAAAKNFMAVKDRLILLPPGTVCPSGGLEKQMMEDGNGWVRTANEISLEGRWMTGSFYSEPGGGGLGDFGGWLRGLDVYVQGDKEKFDYPLVNRRGSFGSPPGAGEYQIHWLDIVFRLGWAENIEEYRRLGTECVNEFLANLNSDGYVGIFPPDQEFKGAGAQVHDSAFETFTDRKSVV